MTQAHHAADRACDCPSCAAAEAMVLAFVGAMNTVPPDVADGAAVTALMGLHRFALDAAGDAEAQGRVAAALVRDLLQIVADRGVRLVDEADGEAGERRLICH